MINLCLFPSVKPDVCRLKGYESWFFIDTFTLRTTNDTGDSEDTKFASLTLTKLIDSCTPQLMKVCCNGASLRTLEIEVLETSGSGVGAGVQTVFRLKFARLKVDNWSIDQTTETITLTYQKVACQFYQGKCDYGTLQTSYSPTGMMGWQLYSAEDEKSRAGGTWEGE
jgi:type VI protein secretion system component Hcp